MKFLLLLLWFPSMLSSCLHLQAVHQFSEEAVESVATFNEINLTFQQLCERKQMMAAIRQGAVQRSYEGDCDIQPAADSAIFKMQQAMIDYLNGLLLLTANKRISYSLSPLTQAIPSNTLIQLKEEEAEAYQNMLELIMQASTEAYRRKKTITLIEQAQVPLGVLIDKLIFMLDNPLREAVTQQKEMLYLQTRELADSAQSILEKRNLILAYADQLDYYKEQQQLLDTYMAILRSVKDGHQQLYEKRNQLNKDDALEALAYYTGELRQLQSEFEKIR